MRTVDVDMNSVARLAVECLLVSTRFLGPVEFGDRFIFVDKSEGMSFTGVIVKVDGDRAWAAMDWEPATPLSDVRDGSNRLSRTSEVDSLGPGWE